MGEIPEDIRVAARSYVGHNHRWIGPDEVTTLIARAILAERKRCADAVHRAAKDFYGNTDQMYAASLIASSIEAGA